MADIAVVGAGVNGLATAHALVEDGHDVVVYEQFGLGHSRGSSHGRSRIFRFAYPEAHWVRLAVEALEGWRALEAASGEELLILNGLLELIGPDGVSSAEALTEVGVEFELLGREEAEQRFGVAAADGATILHQPEAGIVRADRALRAFLHALRIEEGHRVESLDDVEEPVVVVTAGPWARRLLEPAGIELPVIETRETVAFFAYDGRLPSVVAEIVTRGHGFYALADPDYGLKVGSHMRGKPDDPNQVRRPNNGIVQEIVDWTNERFPNAGRDPLHTETCFYTTTDDERFILERHGRIVVGSACSGHGFKFAPAVGKRLAALAVEALG